MNDDDCCSQGVCRNDSNNNAAAELRTISKGSIYEFFRHVRSLYAAALGENTGLYILGFNHIGIPIAYAMGYIFATFTTFVTILGRYKYGSSGNSIDSCCCSVLEQQDNANKGFLSNIITTFKNFGLGLMKIKELPGQPNLIEIFK